MSHLGLPRSRWLVGGLTLVVLSVLGPERVQAGPRWKLIYYRQTGNQMNANHRAIENHVFNENGTKAAGVGVTNRYNPGSAIFGYTDVNGYCRMHPLDPNNCTYDVTIYDPSTPKDQTPDFNWENPLASWPQFYSYTTHWMYVSEESSVVTYPNDPVYYHDLVDGINQASGFNGNCEPYGWVEAPGAGSDYAELPDGGWAAYQAQTFVVPTGINRIVSAMAFLIRADTPPGPKFTYRATIHQGSPTGAQIGPAAVSREVYSSEFREAAVCWGLDAVPVTAGLTYALRVEATDGQGFNAFRSVSDVYPNGCVYHGTTQVPNKDLVAIVVGVRHDTQPPVIDRAPGSFEVETYKGRSPSSSTFTIANAGGGMLNYNITDNASWLYTNPASGQATSETDEIHIIYTTESLPAGSHTGTITISASGASNTPQYITVHLTIPKPADYNRDGDVDQEDFGRFQRCYTASGEPQTDPACAFALLDPDDDVDLADYGKFQACLSGAGVPSDPACAD